MDETEQRLLALEGEIHALRALVAVAFAAIEKTLPECGAVFEQYVGNTAPTAHVGGWRKEDGEKFLRLLAKVRPGMASPA